jgi:hypothetical protein
MKKKIISIVISCLMLLSLFPLTAFAADTTYGIWLGSTQVTSDNMTDILGDGKASYDPGTTTLTLNGVTIDATSGYTTMPSGSKVACQIDDSFGDTVVTINVIGDNSIKPELDTSNGSIGIWLKSNINFTGTGSLHANGNSNNAYAMSSTGIRSDKAITVNGPKIYATGAECDTGGNMSAGIQTNTITVNSGYVEAVGANAPTTSYGICGNVTINGGIVKAKSSTAASNTKAFKYNPTLGSGMSLIYGTSYSDASTWVVYGATGTDFAFNNPIDENGSDATVTKAGNTKIAVWGKIIPLETDPDGDDVVINVNIAWGNLKYDYSQGKWNPVTLAYENAGWSPVESGVSDKLTVTNRSNVKINAGLSFANIGGKYANLTTTNVFFNEAAYTTNVTNSTFNLDSAVSGTADAQSAYLKISGTPTEMTDTTDYVRIGTVTVNIEQTN